MAFKALDGGTGGGAVPTLNNFSVTPAATATARFSPSIKLRQDEALKYAGKLIDTGVSIKNQLDEDEAADKINKWKAYQSEQLQKYRELAGERALKDEDGSNVFNNFYSDRYEKLQEITEGMNGRVRYLFDKGVIDSDNMYHRGMESHRFESYKDVRAMIHDVSQTEDYKIFDGYFDSQDFTKADEVLKQIEKREEDFAIEFKGVPREYSQKIAGYGSSKLISGIMENALKNGNTDKASKLFELYGGKLKYDDWSRLSKQLKEGAYANIGPQFFEAFKRGDKVFTFNIPEAGGSVGVGSGVPSHIKNIVANVQKIVPNLKTDFMLTHFNLEGGDWNRAFAVNNHNYAGIKYAKWMDKYGVKPISSGTKEDFGKGLEKTTQVFASFPSDEAFAQVYGRIMGGRHKNALNAKTIREFGESLQGSGYATDKSYASKLEGRFNSLKKGNTFAGGGVSARTVTLDLDAMRKAGFNPNNMTTEQITLFVETNPEFKKDPYLKSSVLSAGRLIGAINANRKKEIEDRENRKFMQAEMKIAQGQQTLTLMQIKARQSEEEKKYSPSETDMHDFNVQSGYDDARKFQYAGHLFRIQGIGGMSESRIDLLSGGQGNLLNKMMHNERNRVYNRGKFRSDIPPVNNGVVSAVYGVMGLPFGTDVSGKQAHRFGEIIYNAANDVMAGKKKGEAITPEEMIEAVQKQGSWFKF